ADQIGPLDMFKIGVGPSSSHTVGPMLAALEFRHFVESKLTKEKQENKTPGNLHFQVELYGSLSATGKGHATDGAVCAGLLKLHPRTSEPQEIWAAMPALEAQGAVEVGDFKIEFQPSQDIKWAGWTMGEAPLPHPNTIVFKLMSDDKPCLEQT